MLKYVLPITESHETSLRELTEKIRALGGDDHTPITIEADGEPVYIYIAGGG